MDFDDILDVSVPPLRRTPHQRYPNMEITCVVMLISLLSHLCFVWIPSRLNDTSYFEWLVAGVRLNYCVWSWLIYALLYHFFRTSFNHYMATILTTSLLFIVLVWATYKYHTAWVLAERRAGRRPRDRCRLYPIDVPLVPTLSWMLLWCLAYCTMWGWVDATGLLINDVFPTCAGILVMYLVVCP
eukprot:PhM_4_TR172/c0_g1_i1/m.64559